MGCSNSNDKDSGNGNGKSKSQRFAQRLNRREPLAIALRDVYDEFLSSCEDVSSGKRKVVKYRDFVQVNKSSSEANKMKLTYETAKDTSADFLGYAMDGLAKKNWGGKVHSNLHGAPGRSSELKITGKLEFDTVNSTITVPLNADFKFFCANE